MFRNSKVRKNFITEAERNDEIVNTRQAASFLKSLGFIKGKKFRGVPNATYYIGDNCGVILHSTGIYFPKRYNNITDDIIDSDFTLKNTLPIMGFSASKGYKINEYELKELVAYTLLNNGRDVILHFPTTKKEIEENIRIVQKDGKEIRNIIDSDLKRVSKKESYYHEAEKDRTDVIVKVGNKWRIKGKKQKYWDAEYDTKADAQAALRAYWANKGESFRRSLRSLRSAKLEKKNVKEMAGNIDTKSRDGVSLYLPYTSHDIELVIGGGNLGSFHVNAKITDKESLRKAVDKVIKRAAHNIQADEKDAIEAALEKHLSHMRESKISNLRKRSNKKYESTTDLRDGDVMLTYTGSEIDFDEMKNDVLSLLHLRNADKLVLRIADECQSDEEDEEMILATGEEALEKFYDTCTMVFEQGDYDVAIYLSRFDEITNFYEKLCLE